MRKSGISITDVKRYILSLGNQPIKILINKGRKKVISYNGNVAATYPQVFTVKVVGDENVSSLSCSYSDVICGEVKIMRKKGLNL